MTSVTICAIGVSTFLIRSIRVIRDQKAQPLCFGLGLFAAKELPAVSAVSPVNELFSISFSKNQGVFLGQASTSRLMKTAARSAAIRSEGR